MLIKENVSLKMLNTFGVDVTSKYFVEAFSMDEIKEIISLPVFQKSNKLILGGGSNLLFTKNFDGLVLKNSLKGIEIINEDADSYYIKAAAGEIWHEFVMHCVNKNYAGLENLSLIPGCVGASPMQNIGAYGVEIKDRFFELEAIDVETGTVQKFNNQQCEFGYRESVFKKKLKNKFIIISVTFKLNKIPKFNISYGAIEKELEVMGVQNLSIQSISKAVCNIRSSKLPNPAEIGNAGSFFKNPEITKQQFEKLNIQFPEIVAYNLENGNMKLAAGWLIEKCGWKGKSFGDAGVHKNQALVLVNYANATGSEIFELSEKIIDSVKNVFGVELEREVNIF